MKFHRLPRLIAALAVVGLTLIPATAYAGCALIISPNPGWRGADVAFTGTGFAANTGYYVNFGGERIKDGTTNENGVFSFNYTIPGDYPTGTTNVFATDYLPSCEQNPDYQVNASGPTTTTTPTTSVTTTTTIPPTTTTIAAGSTTTVGETTTTVAEATTTTVLAGGETTTTVASSDSGGGGIPIYVWGVIALLVAIILLLLSRSMGGKK